MNPVQPIASQKLQNLQEELADCNNRIRHCMTPERKSQLRKHKKYLEAQIKLIAQPIRPLVQADTLQLVLKPPQALIPAAGGGGGGDPKKWSLIETCQAVCNNRYFRIGVLVASALFGGYLFLRSSNKSKALEEGKKALNAAPSQESLKAAYENTKDMLKHYLKGEKHSLYWLLNHGKVTKDLFDWIVDKGKLKKHW